MSTNDKQNSGIEHYHWAGLDFMFGADGRPVLLEANRCSHMVWEYLLLNHDDTPFQLTADLLNAVEGPICLMWRRGDPFPGADEDACWIADHLSPYLNREPLVCHVEDNREATEELLTREGERVRPGAIFRWWYDLPWSFERSGVRVINPNSVWVAVRDKLACYHSLVKAQTFTVPQSFAVESTEEAKTLLQEHAGLFEAGYVLKPRVGFGGHGVQVADVGEAPQPLPGNYLLSERIRPPAARRGLLGCAGVCDGGSVFGRNSAHESGGGHECVSRGDRGAVGCRDGNGVGIAGAGSSADAG